MSEKFRIFMLLLHKNFLVRKRHWIQSLLLQVLIPIGLILISQSISMRSDDDHVKIFLNDTYYPVQSEDSLMDHVQWDMDVRYTPSNIITDKIMEDVRKCLRLEVDDVVASPNEDAMVMHFLHSNDTWSSNRVGIVFQSITDNVGLPKLFKYKLRTVAREPSKLFSSENSMEFTPRGFDGVSTVQVPLCLDKAYIKQVVPSPGYETKISIQQIPYPSYVRVDKFTNDLIPFAMVSTFAFLVVLCVEITFPANEKFIGINVLMSVNGISNRLNLLSWFVSGAIWSTSYLLPIVVISKYYKTDYSLPFLLNGNAFLVWIALFIHICHLLTFGAHLSAYFWKPFRGIITIIILILSMHTLKFSIQAIAVQRLFLYLGILSPNFILSRMITEMYKYENTPTGVSWSNLFTSKSDDISEGSIGVMMLFSIIGILFHFFMTVYIYAIRPGKYGVPRHPFFCFQRNGNKRVNDNDKIMNSDREDLTKKEFEYVQPESLETGIQIRGLKKVYSTDLFGQTKVEALRSVSIDIYASQITALLGHNGAGKTTMMSILSGLTDATEGVVFIDGRNILNQTNSINNNIGLCPQENMLFPDLTVHQQLILFGMIRANNRTRYHLENEVGTLLNKVHLIDKANNYPAQLSGGQKRRLCLALAIIGDAKVLILDEPTSGMDAESKREVWDILLKMRGEKTILISTHDMEEADILGDRVAIMHTGKLRCYGSSMFLKKLYGDGQVEVTLSVEPWCDVTKISREIDITVNILNRDDGKIVLTIPPAESLPKALDKLENSKKELGITGMSVSIITLEQVFVRVTKDESIVRDSNDNIEEYEKVTGYLYYLQTFSAFFVKKIIYARKNPWNFLISTILPCIFMVTTMGLFIGHPVIHDPYAISLSVYSDTDAYVNSDNRQLSDIYQKTIRGFGGTVTEVNPNTSVSNELLNYGRKDRAMYRSKVIVSAEFNNTPSGEVAVNGFYSGAAVLGKPITINCITNTILKALTNDEEYRIEMSTQALPLNHKLYPSEVLANSIIGAISLIVFLAPAIAMYVIQPLNEILSGVKQLQFMTGAPKLMYWTATFLFDFVQYIVSISLLLVFLIIADSSTGSQIYHGTEISITLALFVLFGLSVFPIVYICTFFKRSNNATIIILTIMPIVMVIAEIILHFLEIIIVKEAFKTFRLIQSYIFLLVPHVSLAHGYYAFLATAIKNGHCRRMSTALPEIYNCENPISYFAHEKNIRDLKVSLLWLGVLPILYCGIIFILEQRYFETLVAKIRRNQPIADSVGMDEIVKKEKQIINEEIAKRTIDYNSTHDNGNIFLVQELRKSYGNLHAVKGISFRVKESECFGLLGVNGAGKSTTFKMLTGDIMPDGGTVYLKQYNITSDRSNYLSSMGYCPQQDAIITTLNSWEHLYLFARLRGIPPSQVSAVVKQWITKLNLTPCAQQPSGTYSGGNKRRLNIALALIGNPPLVLMDEPTTGVDPAARRSLWSTLKTCQDAGQSIILTSHSMEECEALCSRLVIMVGGEIVCVGASEQLKQRFGSGYNIHVKLSSTQRVSDVEAIKQRITTTLNCHLTDQNTGFLGYHVVDPKATWTIMYTLMDELKNEYDCIEDYVVLSSTLEQLFIQFARSSNNRNNNHHNFNSALPV